jgi:hypothetical protein
MKSKKSNSDEKLKNPVDDKASRKGTKRTLSTEQEIQIQPQSKKATSSSSSHPLFDQIELLESSNSSDHETTIPDSQPGSHHWSEEEVCDNTFFTFYKYILIL